MSTKSNDKTVIEDGIDHTYYAPLTHEEIATHAPKYKRKLRLTLIFIAMGISAGLLYLNGYSLPIVTAEIMAGVFGFLLFGMLKWIYHSCASYYTRFTH